MFLIVYAQRKIFIQFSFHFEYRLFNLLIGTEMFLLLPFEF